MFYNMFLLLFAFSKYIYFAKTKVMKILLRPIYFVIIVCATATMWVLYSVFNLLAFIDSKQQPIAKDDRNLFYWND